MISPSQANTYRRCPESWRLRYQEGIKLAPAWAIRGRAAHRGIEINMAQKVETRRDLPEDDVLDAFRTSVREAFHTPSDEEIVLESGESEASITDAGVIGLAAYHRDLAPGIQPIMTEARVQHDFGGLVVQGIIDILDESLIIRDSKMMTDMPKAENLQWETQPPVYSALVEAVTGTPPAGVIFDVVALGRGRVPNPRTVSIPIAVPREQIARTLDDLRQVEASIKAGIVYRRPGPWTCRGCGYQRLCWGAVDGQTRQQPGAVFLADGQTPERVLGVDGIPRSEELRSDVVSTPNDQGVAARVPAGSGTDSTGAMGAPSLRQPTVRESGASVPGGPRAEHGRQGGAGPAAEGARGQHVEADGGTGARSAGSAASRRETPDDRDGVRGVADRSLGDPPGQGMEASRLTEAATCRGLVASMKLKPQVRDHLFTKHCGTTAIEGADPAAVHDLRLALEQLAEGVRR